MKKGLILEGGAMRGMFTAGVLDVFMEYGIAGFDGAIGVSAGAAFGCNYKSGQIGRALRYNTRFCRDPRYASFRSLIKTGDIYNAKFAYYDIPHEYDYFDTEAFAASSLDFYVVATDMVTGRPVYHLCTDGGDTDIEWMRASASMPGFSNVVRIGDRQLSDGGTADSIPIRFFESIGYEKNVIVLTQPEGFVKKKNSMLPLLKLRLKKYPELIRALEVRHEHYNETLEYIARCEERGTALVIRPPEPLKIKSPCHDPNELIRVCNLGRRMARERLKAVAEFLAE